MRGARLLAVVLSGLTTGCVDCNSLLGLENHLEVFLRNASSTTILFCVTTEQGCALTSATPDLSNYPVEPGESRRVDAQYTAAGPGEQLQVAMRVYDPSHGAAPVLAICFSRTRSGSKVAIWTGTLVECPDW
jgi:hypothetical protein